MPVRIRVPTGTVHFKVSTDVNKHKNQTFEIKKFCFFFFFFFLI